MGISIAALTGLLSNLFVNADSEWFMSLIKPEFYPPNMVFMIAWIIIYILTAIVIARVINNKLPKVTLILIIVQCVLQILWCLVFFTLEMPVTGLLILIALVVINVIINYQLNNKDELAGWLYFLIFSWIVYACMLNYSIVMLN